MVCSKIWEPISYSNTSTCTVVTRMAFYQEFRYCSVPFSPSLNDGHCTSSGLYNTKACGFDGGDCIKFNEIFPSGECKVLNGTKIGDGICDNNGNYNTPECNYDGGDCLDFNEKMPGCKAEDLKNLGNGICDSGEYRSKECLDDDGDCAEFNAKYPDCNVEWPMDGRPNRIGDGKCQSKPENGYWSAECGWEDGDCDKFAGNFTTIADILVLYPDCESSTGVPFMFANEKCDTPYNTEACGWDGGDCLEFTEKYPDCNVERPYRVGDGKCHGAASGYNTPECGFDGGDCVEFDLNYPNCTVDRPDWIGDGECDGAQYNTAACGFDGGDCEGVPPLVVDNLPDCFVTQPYKVGDGFCQGENNVEGCAFDGGDCAEFNAKYPGCKTAEKPEEVGNGICNAEYNTEECRYDGGDCSRAVLFLYGEEVTIDKYKEETRTFSIVQSSFSAVSLLASIAILCIIHRSYDRLSTTINRLLFGLCVSDILSSFAQSFATLPAPKVYSDVIWNAHGSVASCEAQGFFIFVGSMAAPLYNCSMCFFYLAVLKYNKKQDFITNKIEPFLHAVPIVFSLIGAFTILGLKAFNPNMTYCFIGPDPTCDDIDCDRIKDSSALFYVFSAAPYIILPCVIVFTMSAIYRLVLTQEKKLEKYGIGALRNLKKKAAAAAAAKAEENKPKEKESKTIRNFFRRKSKKEEDVAVRKKRKQSRVILNTAFSYSLAFLFSYLLPMVISIRTLLGLKSGTTLSILVRIFFPLQGVFNFLVFIYPQVVAAKRKHKNIGWFKAFLEALKSRGSKKMSRSLKSSRIKKSTSTMGKFTSKFKSTFSTMKLRTSQKSSTSGLESTSVPQSSMNATQTNPPSGMVPSPTNVLSSNVE